MNAYTDFRVSTHANKRILQRRIPPMIVEWLYEYGTEKYDGKGARILYFDKRSRRTLAKNIDKIIISRMGSLLNTYIVISNDDVVITTGYRTKRIKH